MSHVATSQRPTEAAKRYSPLGLFLAVLLALVPTLFLRLPLHPEDSAAVWRNGSAVSEAVGFCLAASGIWSLDEACVWPLTWLHDLGAVWLSSAANYDREVGLILWRSLLVLLSSLAVFRLAELFTRGFASAVVVWAVWVLFLWGNAGRAEMITAALFLPLFLLVIREPGAWTFLWVSAISILWVNSGSSFLLQYFVLAALLFGSLTDREERQQILLLLALVAITSLFHPHAPDAYRVPFSLVLQSPPLPSFSSPNPHTGDMTPKLIVLLLTIFVLCSKPLTTKWISLAVVGVLAALLIRWAEPMLALVAALSAGMLIGQWFPTAEREKSEFVTLLPLIAAAGILSLVVALGIHQPRAEPPSEYEAILESVRGRRLLNDSRIGHRLAAAQLPTFIDSRSDLFAAARPEVLRDYQTVMQLQEGWEEVLRKWDFSLSLLREDSALLAVLRDRMGWQEVWRTTPEETKTDLGAYKLSYVLLERPREEQ